MSTMIPDVLPDNLESNKFCLKDNAVESHLAMNMC